MKIEINLNPDVTKSEVNIIPDSIENEENLVPEIVDGKAQWHNDQLPVTGDKNLVPCCCPIEIEKDVDAKSKCRLLKFEIDVENLCPNKDFLLFVAVYKIKNWPHGTDKCKEEDRSWHPDRKVSLGQICRRVRLDERCNECGCKKECFILVIDEPICSDEKIYYKIFGNYVEACNIDHLV